MQALKDIDVKGKRVLVRCDFNVPMDEQGNITEDFRIQESLPTITYLLAQGATVTVMSHLGDGGESLDPVQKRLDELLGTHVELLENLRNNPGETKNDPEFAKQLAANADIYVNDAFSVCHRKHASVVAITQFLPSYAGLLLEKEITSLNKILQSPEKPMVAVVGGAKVETKSKFINNISRVADTVIIGGLLAAETKEKNIQFDYPEKIVSPVGELKALDISDESIALFRQKISGAKTVLWNGAVGKFEEKPHDKGTRAIADAIIASGAFSVVGGGETVEFLQKESLLDKFSHVSTGGGAMLAYLGGEELPGIKALES